MTLLEFLARTTGAWVITSGQLILNHWSARLSGASVLGGSGSLVGVCHLFLGKVLL